MELTLDEVKPILKYIIQNNERLQENGKMPVACCLESQAGIGKSETIETLTKELGYNYVKLSMSQISEIGDCVGYPVRLHYVCKNNECTWISPELIDAYVKGGWTVTDETKMSYALPEWFKNIDINKGTIINLDDWTRSLPHIAQALMELIYQQELWSFRLPPKTTILLSSNPENGDYNISSSLDEAQKTRLITFNVKFDIHSWSKWAENAGLDGRAINFFLQYSNELMDDKGTHHHIMNPRSYTLFANTISGISDWSNADSLAIILQIASGCFDDDENVVGHLFTTFIANKLDKLVTPEDMLLGKWETVKTKIKNCVYKADTYRPEIASILGTRLLNYSEYYFKQKGSKTDIVVDRILELIDCNDDPKEKMLFSEDILFNIVKVLMKNYPTRTNKFVLNSKIRRKITD